MRISDRLDISTSVSRDTAYRIIPVGIGRMSSLIEKLEVIIGDISNYRYPMDK